MSAWDGYLRFLYSLFEACTDVDVGFISILSGGDMFVYNLPAKIDI
jgi:hypothetical protein